MTKRIPALLLYLLPAVIFAQPKSNVHPQTWEFGAQLGLLQGQNDLNNLGFSEVQPAGGAFFRYHADPVIALRGNLLFSKLSGDDLNYSANAGRGFSFTAPLLEATAMVEIDLFGKRRWNSNGAFNKTISPYFLAGVGYAFTRPTTLYKEGGNNQAAIDKDKAVDQIGAVALPVGGGLKVDLNERLLLNLEAGLRLTFNDHLDGVSHSGNPKRKDTYLFAGLGLSYRIINRPDADQDGIEDYRDACPNEKGTEATKGCPDTDSDGLIDKLDACPNEAGPTVTKGCPDSDGDGIADMSDACPDKKGTVFNNGCPDSDGDGIPDHKDQCPEAAGTTKFQGCPDSDGDGIIDRDDQCPNEAGPLAEKGCPIKDRDKDGVLDELDKCPDLAGTVANNGCPVVSDTDKKILESAVYGVQFDNGKASLMPASYAILDQIAEVMRRNTVYTLTITGHTDNKGSAQSNQRLSEARAKTCFDYLVSKGVYPARMSHLGLGSSQPVADNGTWSGRVKNRRVTFELVAPE